MSRGHNGMQKNVQIALGLVPARKRPHADVCVCGVERNIGTDREVMGLAPIGRMIEWCPRCNRAIKVYPGPRMLTREDKEGEFKTVTRKDGRQYRVPIWR